MDDNTLSSPRCFFRFCLLTSLRRDKSSTVHMLRKPVVINIDSILHPLHYELGNRRVKWSRENSHNGERVCTHGMFRRCCLWLVVVGNRLLWTCALSRRPSVPSTLRLALPMASTLPPSVLIPRIIWPRSERDSHPSLLDARIQSREAHKRV